MRSLFLFLLLSLLLSSKSPVAQSSSICLNQEEQKLYDLLMAYRKKKKLNSIPLSAKLSRVAQLHARDLSENFNSQTGNCNIHSWSKKGKWKPCCYTADHKQASCMWDKPKEISGYESPGFEISYYNSAGAKAEGSLISWQQSQGHNKVIINDGTWEKLTWNAIGIGIYKEYSTVWFGQITDESVPEKCN